MSNVQDARQAVIDAARQYARLTKYAKQRDRDLAMGELRNAVDQLDLEEHGRGQRIVTTP